MDAEKVKALKDRAERAQRIASNIEQIAKATKLEDIDWLFRDEALRLAKAGILARLESELLDLLGEKHEPDPRMFLSGLPTEVAMEGCA